MIKIDLINAKRVFDEEVNYQMSQAVMNVSGIEKVRIIEDIDRKIIHTYEVISDGLKVAEELGFNSSTKDFTHVALLNHDIGRFAQIRHTGNYNDSILYKMTGIKNHGILGAQILEAIIDEQLPKTPIFHKPIINIVKEHVDKVNTNKELMVLSSNLLKNYSMEELLSSKRGNIDNVISAITQIVQDVDRLDIFHQILDDRWEPMKASSDIDSSVFKMFYNGQYLDMAYLKQKGLWNANVGELVRLGFINQIKLLSVAKVIQKENIIMRLKEKRQNPKVLDAFDYANEKLNEMIENTEDGITVGKVYKKM